MSASHTTTSALRSTFFASAASLTGGDDAQHDARSIDCTGSCFRGVFWALILEGAAVAAVGVVLHAMRILHG